ncbi:hypothetical protein pb186bvf_012264 [Paramecium bursaria]
MQILKNDKRINDRTTEAQKRFISRQLNQLLHSQSNQVNIFKGHPADFNDVDNPGPKFDNNGNIIRRTIVGNPDLFNKQQNTLKIDLSQQLKHHIYDTDSTPFRMTVSRKISKLRSTSNLSKQHLQPAQNTKITVSREAIYSFLEESQKRIDSNRKIEKTQEDQLPFFEKIQMTKERRCLENYDEQNRKWDDINNGLAYRCSRSPEKTLLDRSQDYRLKVELLEQLPQKTNEDKIWYQILRNESPPTKQIEHVRTKPQQCRILSKKFLSQISNQIKEKYGFYDKIEGINKFQKELHLAKDIAMRPLSPASQQQEDISVQSYNKSEMSKKGLYRLPKIV